MMAKRGQFSPPEGRAISAASKGKHQNSPMMQWNVRSVKWLLLYASASIRMICKTADGIDSMLLSKVEKPMRLSVRERYP